MEDVDWRDELCDSHSQLNGLIVLGLRQVRWDVCPGDNLVLCRISKMHDYTAEVLEPAKRSTTCDQD